MTLPASLGLGGPQAAALDGRPARGRLQPLGRLGLRPAAGRPVHPKRHPLALGHQRLERHRHAVGRRVELGDLGGGLDPQGAQARASAPRRRTPAGPARRGAAPAGAGRVARLRRERGRRLEHGGRGVVGVVEHEQGRKLALLGAADRLERGVGGARARGVDHRPLGLDRGGELGGEPGLADPRGTGDERDPGPPLLGLGPALSQPPQLAVSTGEKRRSALELARELGRRAGVEGGIVGEDLLLELAQLGPGLDPDLLDSASGGPRGSPPRPRTGARRGTARACAGRGSARGRGARRSAPRGGRSPRRGVPPRARRRS